MRPDRVVLVCGTGTDVGKTWVCSRLLGELRRRGIRVAVRKPAQSFDVDASGAPVGGPTDAEVLGAASCEVPDAVCPPWRSYPRAMAPPMAAEALGLPAFSVEDLAGELHWPAERVAAGVVELAGGVRSPQACDGDATHLVDAIRPDLVLLVADAGLGCLNGVRLSMEALARHAAARPHSDPVVVLDRFDSGDDLHRRNNDWLAGRDGYRVVQVPGGESVLADLVLQAPSLGSPARG